jgi:Holliday junction resolvase RusA-like endonuclease
MIKFFLEGTPHYQKRHRMGRGRTYDPSSSDKKNVEWLIKSQCKQIIFHKDAPLFVQITAGYEPPKSWAKKRKALSIGAYKLTKPDADNIAKFYLDCMNGLVYEDDNQVASLHVEKVYAETAFIEIICDFA